MYISNSNNRTKTHLRYYITIRSKRCFNERISCRTVLEGIEEPCLLRTCRNRTQITNSVRNWTTGCFHHSAYTVFEEQLNNCSIEFTNVNLRLCYSAATNQKKKKKTKLVHVIRSNTCRIFSQQYQFDAYIVSFEQDF